MSLLHRTALATTLAVGSLLNLSLCAAPQPRSEPIVPVRSLAIELAGVEEGTPAYIHTHYGTGMGVLLSSGDEVVTARHNVLTPSGTLADEIAVGIAQLPLHNVVEVRVVAVAQDPARDLVLLRPVQGAFPPAVQQTPSARTPSDCTLPGAAPCPPLTGAAAEKQDDPPSRIARVKVRTARIRRARRAGTGSATLRRSKQKEGARASSSAAVHLVYDGPVTRKAKAPSPVTHDDAVKRRVVEDGPLRAH